MVSMGGLVLDYWQFVNFHSLHFSYEKLPLITVFSLGRRSAYASALPKSAEPQKGGSSPTQLHDKRDVNISQHLFYGVMKVMTLEPSDKNNVSRKKYINNICCGLISVMKQSTQEYYNMRMVLGLEVA